MLLFEIAPDTSSLIAELLRSYGPTGAAFGGLLTILVRANKRYEKQNEELINRIQHIEERQLNNHKDMIADYVTLVKDNSNVISKLTGCLTAIKDTLDRIDRRTEDK